MTVGEKSKMEGLIIPLNVPVLKLCDVTNLDPDAATFYEVLFRRRKTTKQRPCKIGTSLSV